MQTLMIPANVTLEPLLSAPCFQVSGLHVVRANSCTRGTLPGSTLTSVMHLCRILEAQRTKLDSAQTFLRRSHNSALSIQDNIHVYKDAYLRLFGVQWLAAGPAVVAEGPANAAESDDE
jgi:hypothetical protein